MRRLAACALALFGSLAHPQPCTGVPLPPLEHVAFAPLPGATLPLDARFVDEHGTPVRLRDYLRARPAIVVPAYYGCSNLCGVVLNSLAAALRESGMRARRDIDIVVVGIDPLETASAALRKKRAVLGESREADAAGWHFLTGTDAEVARVTAALGYRYAHVANEAQYAHAAGVAFVAPGGRIARVLYGVSFPPAALREALAAASFATDARSADGTRRDGPASTASNDVATGVAQQWLLCFHYDPRVGRYSSAAMNAVRGAAAATLLAFGACVIGLRWRERRRPPTERR